MDCLLPQLSSAFCGLNLKSCSGRAMICIDLGAVMQPELMLPECSFTLLPLLSSCATIQQRWKIPTKLSEGAILGRVMSAPEIRALRHRVVAASPRTKGSTPRKQKDFPFTLIIVMNRNLGRGTSSRLFYVSTWTLDTTTIVSDSAGRTSDRGGAVVGEELFVACLWIKCSGS